jgi:hypothetical protein
MGVGAKSSAGRHGFLPVEGLAPFVSVGSSRLALAAEPFAPAPIPSRRPARLTPLAFGSLRAPCGRLQLRSPVLGHSRWRASRISIAWAVRSARAAITQELAHALGEAHPEGLRRPLACRIAWSEADSRA